VDQNDTGAVPPVRVNSLRTIFQVAKGWTQVKTSLLRDKPFERILLIKPSAVGDVIHTLPILVKLRARYPTARIDWLLTPPLAELLGRHPALSHVVLFDRRLFASCWRSWSATTGLLRLLTQLRKTRYDLVIDLHGQFRSAVFCLASGAPTRIGFDKPRPQTRRVSRPLVPQAYSHGWTGAREGAWLSYTHRIPIPTLDVHAIDRYLWLGPLLGLDEDAPNFDIPLPPEAQTRIEELLKKQGGWGAQLAVLVPGTIWPTKHWTVEGFAGVARHLIRRGCTVVLAGTPGERDRCREVARLAPGTKDLCGLTTLTDLAALLRLAAICVTNDSGSMHLAVALGRPVVSVFGPTDPLWIGPYRRPSAVVQAEVPCSPCYLRRITDCPNGHTCMREVTAAPVIERIEWHFAQNLPAAS
jgi:lipopolysaccharide heptosyltransferase I